MRRGLACQPMLLHSPSTASASLARSAAAAAPRPFILCQLSRSPWALDSCEQSVPGNLSLPSPCSTGSYMPGSVPVKLCGGRGHQRLHGQPGQLRSFGRDVRQIGTQKGTPSDQHSSQRAVRVACYTCVLEPEPTVMVSHCISNTLSLAFTDDYTKSSGLGSSGSHVRQDGRNLPVSCGSGCGRRTDSCTSALTMLKGSMEPRLAAGC